MKKLFLRLSGERPKDFHGTIRLPPSKSYVHRAFFVASLCNTPSKIIGCSVSESQDIAASVYALGRLGIGITNRGLGSGRYLEVHPKPITSSKNRREIFVGGSGTTARFLISFAALSTDGGYVQVAGDSSLQRRPMQPLLDALHQIGVECRSKNRDGTLPVLVNANGIAGGECSVDGSISSQFISSLLIACTQARSDTRIKVQGDRSEAVSIPYVRATVFVLKYFGFEVHMKEKGSSTLEYYIQGKQIGKPGRIFRPPGDMSSATALIGAAMAARGKIRLSAIDPKIPQADFAFLGIAARLGASISESGNSILASIKTDKKEKSDAFLVFDLKDSPDLVPVLACAACAMQRNVRIRGVGHLRFKESDRLSALKEELDKLGMTVKLGDTSISITTHPGIADDDMKKGSIVLDSHDDHRILMGLTIAGLSGRFGEILISDPSCVAKSYPSFVSDLKSLIHNQNILSIVRRS